MEAGLNHHLVLGPSIWECTHPGALPYTKLKDLFERYGDFGIEHVWSLWYGACKSGSSFHP
jgi:hypothetical protein